VARLEGWDVKTSEYGRGWRRTQPWGNGKGGGAKARKGKRGRTRKGGGMAGGYVRMQQGGNEGYLSVVRLK
jgi:hypothetical protein